ncbi:MULTISPECIES: hypothetical protein [unclassified Marinovum]
MFLARLFCATLAAIWLATGAIAQSAEDTPPAPGLPTPSAEDTPPAPDLPTPSAEYTPPAPGLPTPSAEDSPPAPGLPTPSEIIEAVDTALRLLRAGDTAGANDALTQANDTTFDAEYPPLAKHYPNLGQAIYAYETGDWREVLRYAASVATALSADGFADHPYRVHASVLHGAALANLERDSEAEVLLRRAVNEARAIPAMKHAYGLGLYHLTLLASNLNRADYPALSDEFLTQWSSDWPVGRAAALILLYRDIDSDHKTDKNLGRAIRRARNLVLAVESDASLPPRRLAGFRGYLGLLLAQNGDYDTARDYLEQEYAFYRANGVVDADLHTNIIYLAQVIRYGDTVAEAYQFLDDEVQLARQNGTPPYYIARFLSDQADMAEVIADTDEAQRLLRDAYATVRSVERANHWLAERLRARIALDHPGMAGFAFAPELGAFDAVDFALTPGGEDTLRLFLEGNYQALDAVLTNLEQAGGSDAVTLMINRALYHALVGAHDESIATLHQARRTARTTLGGAIAPNAAIFDLIEATAKIWGTGHNPDSAQGAFDRLRPRSASLGREERSLYHALLAFYHFRKDSYPPMRRELNTWYADYDPRDATGIWDIFAATVVMEMFFGQMDEAVNLALFNDTFQAMARFENLSLARDYLRLVKVINARNGLMNDEALVELGTLTASIGAAVPRGHSLAFSTQFGLASAYQTRENYEESLKWLRLCVVSMRATPYHRLDEIAFMLSRQAAMQSWLGRNEEALSLAQEAYGLIDPAKDRPDMIGEVHQTLANALWRRTGRPELAVDFIDGVLANPQVFSRFKPDDRMSLLNLKAQAQANFAALPDVLATLDRAEAELQTVTEDRRNEVSSIWWNRANAYYWNDAPAEGYAAMIKSNDLYLEWIGAIRAEGGGQGVLQTAYRARAEWEAAIGWDYAQRLPADLP